MIHFLQFFFVPTSGPWYAGQVWGNVVAVVPCGVLAFLWGRAVERALHRKIDAHHQEARQHQEWQAHVLATLHRGVHYTEPPPHPHFDTSPSASRRS